jgi:hypothetical protein
VGGLDGSDSESLTQKELGDFRGLCLVVVASYDETSDFLD